MLNATRDLTLPTTVTGSWPRPSWFTEVLHGRAFKDALGDSRFREQYMDAVSCIVKEQETASRYCSRKRESPRASLKARPRSTSVNHDGRGQEPVTVVGSVSSRVALSMPGFLPGR